MDLNSFIAPIIVSVMPAFVLIGWFARGPSREWSDDASPQPRPR